MLQEEVETPANLPDGQNADLLTQEGTESAAYTVRLENPDFYQLMSLRRTTLLHSSSILKDFSIDFTLQYLSILERQ